MKIRDERPGRGVVGPLAVAGMAGPIIFAALVTAAGFRYPGYSHLRQAISELGGVGARQSIIQNAAFVIVGGLVLAFAGALHRAVPGGKRPWLGPALVGAFAVLASFGSAAFPCDPGCEFESVKGSLHNALGLAGFVSAVGAMFVFARRMGPDPRWVAHSRYTLVSGFAAFVALVGWIMIAKGAKVEVANGLLQRTFVGIWLLWVFSTSVRIFRLSARAPSVTRSGAPDVAAIGPAS